MNKSELIKAVAEKAGIENKEADKAVNATFDVMSDTLKKKDSIQIAGFGSFVAKTRAAREGRNPSTGEKIQIAEKTSATFKPGASLKDL